jgi:hypothetical protein
MISEMYEELFDKNGDPIEHPGKVANIIASHRQSIGYEFDMIKEASNQYYESNYDKQQQEGLFGVDGQGS